MINSSKKLINNYITFPELYANETLYDSLLGDFDKFLNFITETYIPKDHAGTIATSIKDFYFNHIDLKNKTQASKS